MAVTMPEHPFDRWGVMLLAGSAPAMLAGWLARSPFLLAVGVVSFFAGLWCFAVARVQQ